MSKNEKNKPHIAIRIITGVLIAFTIIIMFFTVISVTTLDRNDRNLFGFKFYIVQTDSMSLSDKNAHLDVHFDAGDIILVKKVKNPFALKSGDIISFISTNEESYGETITHMIREPRYKTSGELIGYVTFGTNTDTNDANIVEPEYILGQYAAKLPKVGYFFAFIKTTPGYILCILIPFLLLIAYNGIDVVRLFKKYKKEQNAILDAEKAEIAAEREKNEQMLKEILELKKQLEEQSAKQTNSQDDSAQDQPSSEAEAQKVDAPNEEAIVEDTDMQSEASNEG